MLLWVCLVVLSTFTHLGAYAQATAPAENPMANYISKNQSTPLVKYYQANPSTHQAANAIKMATVLDGPGKQNMNPQAIADMERQIEAVIQITKKVDVLVKEGKTYERAVATVQAQMEVDKAKESSSHGTPASTSPSLSAPVQ